MQTSLYRRYERNTYIRSVRLLLLCGGGRISIGYVSVFFTFGLRLFGMSRLAT